MSVIASERSAGVRTVVVVVAVFAFGVGSGVADVTVAVAVIVPPDGGAVIFTVIVGAAPTRSVLRMQVTIWPLFAHDQPMPVADTNATLPAGRRYSTSTF